jgi:hypothetical protein
MAGAFLREVTISRLRCRVLSAVPPADIKGLLARIPIRRVIFHELRSTPDRDIAPR